jgi:hypothetical protein
MADEPVWVHLVADATADRTLCGCSVDGCATMLTVIADKFAASACPTCLAFYDRVGDR